MAEEERRTVIEVRSITSLNAIQYAPWQKRSRIKKELQSEMEFELMAMRVPRGLNSVRATAVIAFPADRKRDEGNYRSVLEKALGDALTNGGWLTDDTPDQFTFGEVTFQKRPGIPRPVGEIELAYQ